MAWDALEFVTRQLAQGEVPSRRAVKNRSGRTGRKQYQGQKTLARVGGVSSHMAAVYAPADKELCVVVDSRRGWLPDGRPNRL